MWKTVLLVGLTWVVLFFALKMHYVHIALAGFLLGLSLSVVSIFIKTYSVYMFVSAVFVAAVAFTYAFYFDPSLPTVRRGPFVIKIVPSPGSEVLWP